MSSIASLSSTLTGLSAVNIHPHGHKRGSRVGSTDDSGSDSTTAVPATTQQNLFGSLLQSLEQTMAAQSGTAAPAPGATAPIAGVPATSSTAAASAAAGGTLQPASALLQNYANNSLRNPSAGGFQAAAQRKLSFSV